MVPNITFSDAKVTCSCGATYKVANPEMTDSITCGACGSKIHLNENNTHYGTDETPSALVAAMRKATPEQKSQEAMRLVRDGQYADAVEMYKNALEGVVPYRDAFYGMGFSYLKLGKIEKAYVMLGVAAGLGHRGAAEMFQRLHARAKFE